jgi:hypothetical protein
LEEIGFEWRVGAIKPTFEERIEECREFRRENGHLRIPQPSKPSAGDEPPPEGEKARSFCMVRTRSDGFVASFDALTL